MKPREYTPEEAARIELHTESAYAEKKARREHYREARRIRIADGILEHGDLVDEEDVVCPYCGAWVEGEDPIDHTVVAHYEVKCRACQREYSIEVRVRRTYITNKLENRLEADE